MEPSSRRLCILAAGAIALLVGALAGWLLYHRQQGEAPRPVDVARSVPTPPEAPPAKAALPDLAGRVLVAGCRQGECRWSRVVRLERVATVPQGELRRLVARGGTSLYQDEAPEAYGDAVPIQWEAADRSEYAFCSQSRPAFAFPGDDGSYLLHYLDLFDLAGYQLASARAYMRICHDTPFDGEDTALLRRLGYRPGTRSEQVEEGDPRDLAHF
jgi:hypothetical protein